MEQVEAVEQVEGRLSHRAGARLVEQQRRGDADVQRLDVPELRDRDREVARPADERPQPFALRAEDEGEAAGEVGLPHRRPVLAVRGDDPEAPPLISSR